MATIAANVQLKKITFPVRVGFHQKIRQRANDYFREEGLAKTGNWRMFLKTGIILAWFVTSYMLLVFFSTTLMMAVLSAFALAQAFVLIGFNIMHDGAHGSYSKSRKINWLAGFTMDVIGGSQLLWRQKHNILHHTYTNIDGWDEDIATHGVLRLSPNQRWRPWHRLQHVYAFPVYSLLTLSWMSFGDFQKFFSGRVLGYKLKRPSAGETALFVLTKILYVTYMLVIPLFFHPVLYVVIAFLAIHLILGFTLSIVFQLAHTVEGNTFPEPEVESSSIENEWAIHEVETTADFAPRNKLATLYLGGLNFQIEHHLFTRTCHIHYPALSKQVEQTCQEYGVSYTCFPSIRSAVASHYRFLKKMGRRDELSSSVMG